MATSPNQTQPMPPGADGPRMLGRYPLQRLLGKGAMGSVWLSHHPDLDIPVAVKTVHPNLAETGKQFAARFVREARTAARINHPNVVRVFDASSGDTEPYIVMEYVEGMTAAQAIEKQGALAPAAALRIVRQIAEALVAAAEHGIVHRDIKPGNIMIDGRGVPKLADLGLAKLADSSEDSALTMTGATFGSPGYIAPEQATSSHRADVRADIYSLGATFYHLLTGKLPYEANSAYEVIHQHMTAPLPDPRKINADIPGGYAAVIRKMMAKQPDDRYQTPAELVAALARLEANPNHVGLALSRRHLSIAVAAFVTLTVLGFGIALAIHALGGTEDEVTVAALPDAAPSSTERVGPRPGPRGGESAGRRGVGGSAPLDASDPGEPLAPVLTGGQERPLRPGAAASGGGRLPVGTTMAERELAEYFRTHGVALLPEPRPDLVAALDTLGLSHRQLTWADVVAPGGLDGIDHLIVACGAAYRTSVTRPNDVNEAIDGYLQKDGGLLLIPPADDGFVSTDGERGFGPSTVRYLRLPVDLARMGERGSTTVGRMRVKMPFSRFFPDDVGVNMKQRWVPGARPADAYDYVALASLMDEDGTDLGAVVAGANFGQIGERKARIVYVWSGFPDRFGAADAFREVLLFAINFPPRAGTANRRP